MGWRRRGRRLAPDAVFAGENMLNDLRDRLMPFRLRGSGNSVIVCGRDIREQIVHVRFADEFVVGQCEEEGLADAQRRHAVGTIEACLVCHSVTLPISRLEIFSINRN